MKKEDQHQMIEKLRQQRDELKVKIHLAKADAAAEWSAVEEKWANLKNRSEAAAVTGGVVAREIGTTIKEITEEIRQGYERISRLLKK